MRVVYVDVVYYEPFRVFVYYESIKREPVTLSNFFFEFFLEQDLLKMSQVQAEKVG